MIDQSISVKCKKVEVLNVYLDVEPIAFNRGFYSVDMTFFFKVKLAVYTCPSGEPVMVTGFATFCKKVILYGSEGDVKVYTSTDCRQSENNENSNMPKASVQIVDPICLGCRVSECCDHHHEMPVTLPNGVACKFDGSFSCVTPQKNVYVTLGLFSIVQLERSVQMMIPAYDFCIPDKECVSSMSDDPCELFKRIKFPVDSFFPPKLNDIGCED